MNKIILALTFLMIALVGAGAVAASNVGNATADDLNEIAVDAQAVDIVNVTNSVDIQTDSNNDTVSVCNNVSSVDVDDLDGGSEDVNNNYPVGPATLSDKIVNNVPLKVSVVPKSAVTKVLSVSSSNKVSGTVLDGIQSLYGSHTAGSISMALGLTPAQVKIIIKDMKSGKYGTVYKNALLKKDMSLKNTKNAKYIIN